MPSAIVYLVGLASFVFCIWFVVNFDVLLKGYMKRRSDAGDRYIQKIDKLTGKVK